jgi:hypothetical protein
MGGLGMSNYTLGQTNLPNGAAIGAQTGYIFGSAFPNIEQLDAMLDVLRHHGVKSFSHVNFGTVEFFSEEKKDIEVPVVDASAPGIPLEGEEMPSDEEMLFYSTDTFDEIQAKHDASKRPEVTP